MNVNLKKSRKKIFFSAIFVALLLLLSFNIESNLSFSHQNLSENQELNVTTHDPILIDSDDDFISYGFPGSGNESHPYIIENYQISIQYGEAISIQYTTKYFVIRSCILEDSILGIGIFNVAYGTAEVRQNTIQNNQMGMYIGGAEGSIIYDNFFYNNQFQGIEFYHCDSSAITYNTFTRSGMLYAASPGYLDLGECLSYTVTGNTLDGKAIGWYSGLTSTSFTTSDHGQLFLINCNDVTVKNQEIPTASAGVNLFFCDNVILQNNKCGLLLYGGHDAIIDSNEFSNNYIALGEVQNVEVTSNQYDGGEFYIHSVLSSYVKYSNNKVGNNAMTGFYLEECSNCILEDNIITDCLEYGIYAPMSNDIIIRNNVIKNAEEYGIYFAESNYCHIYKNIIHQNGEYGVYLFGWGDTSDYNAVYQNIYLENNLDGIQGYDMGVGNLWYNSSTNKGNYWDDWSGTGEYEIDGSAHNSDLYPLDDTDYDGMPISWELQYDLDPWLDDSAEDPDDDDLTNLEEFNLKTHPRNNDTDDDGLDDGEEVNEFETDPKDEDTDDDGLNDGDEVLVYFTDPKNNDTDGDGYLDGYEVENEYDPLDPNNPDKTLFEIFAAMLAVVITTIIIRRRRK